MSVGETTLIRRVNRSTFLSNLISITFAVGITFTFAYGFFYNSKANDEQQNKKNIEQDNDIIEIKKSIQNAAVFEGTSDVELKALKESTVEIKAHLDKLDDKIDRILLQTKN